MLVLDDYPLLRTFLLLPLLILGIGGCQVDATVSALDTLENEIDALPSIQAVEVVNIEDMGGDGYVVYRLGTHYSRAEAEDGLLLLFEDDSVRHSLNLNLAREVEILTEDRRVRLIY